MNPLDFRDHLAEELALRETKNRRYSLRAFARDLGADYSHLSKVLLGKRSLTAKTIHRWGVRLQLPADRIQRFAVRADSLKKGTLDPYVPIELDRFRLMSSWYCLAIMEIIHLDDFVPSTAWIARKLGIRTDQADEAVQRLQRLGLLKIDARGRWETPPSANTLQPPLKDLAYRQLQKEILEKAMQALEATPLEERDQTAMTLCVDASRLPEARRRITKFRRGLTRFLETGKRKERVYQLSISLFPLTKKT